MSKVSKFFNSPSLFLRDFFDKRVENSVIAKPAVKVAPKSAPKPAAKVAPKTTVKSTPKSTVINAIFTHINFYKSFPVILHSGESINGGANHFRLWLPILMQSKVDFLILVRNEGFYKWVKQEYPWLSVALARRLVDVERLMELLPDTKCVLYPSSTGNNIHITRFSHLNHIFIGHGDSDKNASAHKALRLYDEIWTAGEAHIDRFRNSNFDTAHLKFLKVGRPNLVNILKESQLNWIERMTPRVLYMPTWEGVMDAANYSSNHISGQIIREVHQMLSVPVSVKYHPFTGNRDPKLKELDKWTKELIEIQGLNAVVHDASINISDLIPQNNVYICDISGVVSECLAANAPIFVYIPSDRSIKIVSSNLGYSDYCYTFSSVNELLEKLEIVLAGNDYLAEKRLEAIDYFIGSNETLNNKFIQQLESMADYKNLKYTPRLFDEM